VLKTLALGHIRNQLTKCNIVEEAFSRFASRWVEYAAVIDCTLMARRRYDEIRGLYVDQLARVWMEDSTETTNASINKRIDSFAEGDLEYAAETLSALWEIANKDGDVKAPANTSQTVSPLWLRLLPCFAQECSLDIARLRRQLAPHTGTS